MFKIAIVVFRECLEISLLLGVILAATKMIQRSQIYIILGVFIGILLASLFAFFARNISASFDGFGDEIFNSSIILLTSVIISWTVVWMQGYAKKIHTDLSLLSDNINAGIASKFMLVAVVSTAILRETMEIMLFVYSLSSVGKITLYDSVLGFTIGCLSGVIVGTIIYMGLIKYAGKYVFKISSIMLTLIAAGLAADAAGILTSTGIIENLSEQLWDSSWIISDESMMGKIMHITLGYDSKPNAMQIVFYSSSILMTVIMIKIRNLRAIFKCS